MSGRIGEVNMTQTRYELVLRAAAEMSRQDDLWGVQHYPLVADESERQHYESLASFYKDKLSKARPEAGEVTWHDIAMKEFCEAMAEADHGLIIEELLQTAAVLLSICEDITLRGLADNER